MKKLYFLYMAILIDVIFIPQTYVNSKFTINISGYSFGLFEIVFWIFFVIAIYRLPLVKFRPLKESISLLNKKQILSIYLIIFFIILSMACGILNKNKYFLNEIRSISLYFAVFGFSLFHFNWKSIYKKKYYRNVLIGFCIAGLSVIISFLSSSFANVYSDIVLKYRLVDLYSRSLSGQYGTYSLSMVTITMLIYFIGISNILFGHKSIVYFLMTLIGFISTNIFFHKPIVIAFVIGNIIMFVMYAYLRRNISSFIKILKNIFLAVLLIYIFIEIMPSNIIDNYFRYFNYMWLNIDRTGVEDDLTSGRFKLYAEYGSYALKGWGLAPWGIGRDLVSVNVKTPHNYFIYLSYQIGIAPTLVIIYLITSILHKTLLKLKTCIYNKSTPLYAMSFGILAYLNTMLVQAQFGGTLDKYNSYIFLFYSLLAILLHLNKAIEKSKEGSDS